MNAEIKAGDTVLTKLFVESVKTDYKGEKKYKLCILDEKEICAFNTISVSEKDIIPQRLVPINTEAI